MIGHYGTLFTISDLVSWIVDGINLKNQIRKIDLIKSRSEYQEKCSGREKWIPLQDSLDVQTMSVCEKGTF